MAIGERIIRITSDWVRLSPDPLGNFSGTFEGGSCRVAITDGSTPPAANIQGRVVKGGEIVENANPSATYWARGSGRLVAHDE